MSADGKIIIETSLDSKQFKREIANLEKSNQSLKKVGSSLTNSITKPALVAGGALAGVVLAKGWARMTEIDNAKAKLKSVGNSAEDVKHIMENATEAVKGTAYGLDEAATASASAVAAGIKPGKELTQYLTNTADAAAVAGISMTDMGSILNKATTAGRAYTGDLNQLADRGLPVFQWLADAAGVTAEEIRDMASKGKISSEMLQEAIEKNIGGAAKEIGSSTITGAISNIGASIGRIGANFLGASDDASSFAGMVLPMLNDTMKWLGNVEDKAKDWGSTFADVIKGVVGYFRDGDKAFSKAGKSAKGILNTIKPLLSIVKKLGTAFGNLGSATKVKLIGGLVLAGPAIKIVAKAMTGLQKISGALTTGYAALNVATTGNTGVNAANAAVINKNGTAMKVATIFQSAYSASIAKSSAATAKMTVESIRSTAVTNLYGKSIANTGLYAATSKAAITAHTVATKASAVASGTAAVAVNGLKTAMAMLGGPIGLVLTGLTTLIAFAPVIKSKMDQSASAAKKEAKAIKELSKEYKENKKAREEAYADVAADADVAAELARTVNDLANKENKSAEEKIKLKSAVEQLNNIMPELNLEYDEQKDKLNKSTDAIYAYIEAARQQMYIDAAREQATAAIKDRINAEKELADKQREYAIQADKTASAQIKYDEAKGKSRKHAREEWQKEKATLEELGKSVETLDGIYQNAKGDEEYYNGIIQSADLVQQAIKKYGVEIPQGLIEEINAGKHGVMTSVDDIRKLVEKEGPNFNKAGQRVGKEVPKGAGKKVTAGEDGLATRINSLITNATAEAKETASTEGGIIGGNLGSGISGGMYGKISSVAAAASSLIRQAVDKANAEAEIKSPSRLFKRVVGVNIAKGVAVGISSGTKYATKSVKTLIKSIAKSAKNVKSNFSGIGASAAKKVTKALATGQKKVLAKVNKAFKVSTKDLTSSQKKAITKANSAVIKQIKKAYSKQEKEVKKITDKMEKLSDKYQEKYDDLIARRDALKATLTSFDLRNDFSLTGLRDTSSGSLMRNLERNQKDLEKYARNLNSIKGKIPDSIFAEILEQDVATANKWTDKLLKMSEAELTAYVNAYTTQKKAIEDITNTQYKNTLIADIKATGEELKAYQANMNKLKSKVPDSLLEEILGMDTTSGNELMTALNSMTKKEFDAYIAQWKANEKLADTISKNLIKSDVDALKKSYEKEMNAQMKALKTTMNKLGKEVGKGFTAGLKSIKGSLSKTVKDICNQVIKDTKKKFGIKSPSKVMAGIFKDVIKGGEVGTIKQAPKLLKAAEQTSDSFVERFKRSAIDPTATVARMRQTVATEMANRPAAVQRVVAQMEQGSGNGDILELSLNLTPTMDGKAVGDMITQRIDVNLGGLKRRKAR